MASDLVTSLIYVSRKTLPALKNAEAVNDILLVSRERNKLLQVTGALFSASNTFAQFIEGPKRAIDQLMESITRDARHRDVKIVSVKDGVPRKFPDWTMAYSGDEYYMDRHIRRLFEALPTGLFKEQLEQLEALMVEFGRKTATGPARRS
jgi:hypothetical protein